MKRHKPLRFVEKVGDTLIQSSSLTNLFDSRSKEELDLKSKGYFMRISFDSGGEGLWHASQWWNGWMYGRTGKGETPGRWREGGRPAVAAAAEGATCGGGREGS